MATTAQEVESIVVRLTGDGSQYNSMMKQAQVATTQTGSLIHGMARDIDGFGKTLSRFGEAAVAGYGLNKLRGMVEHAFAAFSEAETIGLRLNATLEANGRQVDALREQYDEFAVSMERLTTEEDDAILNMLRMAETFEVTGTAAQKAVHDAVALASITGGSADSLIRLTAALAKGDVEQAMSFARMVPQLRGIKDQVEFLAKAELLVASGMKAANAEMQSTSGMLKMLSRDYGNMLEDIGKVISEGVRPVVQVLRDFVAWIRALNEDTKRFLTVVLLTTLALLSIGPAIASFRAVGLPALRMMADGFQILIFLAKSLMSPFVVLSAIWTALGAVIATVFSPLGAVIAVAAIAIGLFISAMGGIKPAIDAVAKWAKTTWGLVSEYAIIAWNYVKEKISEFLVWFQPVWRAMGQLAKTAWDLIVQGAEMVWSALKTGWSMAQEYVASIWIAMFGDARIGWNAIRDNIRDAILFAEFTLLNFGKVWDVVWAGIKLGAVSFANFIVKNVFLFMLGPAGQFYLLLEAFGFTWKDFWGAYGKVAGIVMRHVTDTLSTLLEENKGKLIAFAALLAAGPIGWAAAAGLSFFIDWDAAFSGATDALGRALAGVTVTPRGINLPALDALEQRLRDEFNAMKDAMRPSWEEFRRNRLADLGLTPEDIEKVRKPAEILGETIRAGIGKPLDRLDASLYRSMEAVSRVIAYREKVMNPSERPTPSLGSERADAVSPILRRIATATERLAARPPILTEGAGL